MTFFCSINNKTIIRVGFCDLQNNHDPGKGYLHQPSASADNLFFDLDYSGYHRKSHPIIVYKTESLIVASSQFYILD